MAKKNHKRASKPQPKKTQTFNYRPLAFAIAVAISSTLPTVASAATYTVTTTNDTGAGSLREAIGFANGTANVADTIEFDTTLVPPGSTITLNSTLPTISDTLTITGPTVGDASSIILDGNNAHQHMKAQFTIGSGKSLSLENITLQNGVNALGGGAVRISKGDLILTNSLILNNSTVGTYAEGGGIYVFLGDATLNQSTLSGNSTVGTYAVGGGLLLVGGTLNLNQSTVSGNSTVGTYAVGGGLYLVDGTLNLNQSTVSGNSTAGADADGGGLYVLSANSVYLTESTISGNSTTGLNANGGGIYSNAPISLTQSTVSGNSVAGTNADGGGIFVGGNNVTGIFLSTIVSNQSAGGAAGLSVYGYSEVNLINSILSNNTNTATGEGNFRTDYSNYSVNVIYSFFGDVGAEITNISIGNTVNNNNPQLGALLNNGGATLTHLPTVGSPVLNMGSNSFVPSGVTVDQRGTSFNRIIDTTVDIGAVELQTTKPSLVTNNNDSGAGSLRQAVLYTNNSTSLDSIDLSSFAPNQTITLNSDLIITDSLTISGPTTGDPSSLTLDANINSRHITADFTSNTGEIITLENITLEKGRTTGSNDKGGAVYVRNADLVLNHALVTNNFTSGDLAHGGGLSLTSGNITLNQSTLSGNSTTGFSAEGGGLFVIFGDATFNQSTVSNNSTTGPSAEGGGLNLIIGNLTLNQSMVSNNTTTGGTAEGGGIYVEDGSITLNQSTISYNSATGSHAEGGGIYLRDSNSTITQSTITNNSSNIGGAGMHIYGYAINSAVTYTSTLLNTIFSGNYNAITGLPHDLDLTSGLLYSGNNGESVIFNINATNSLLSTNVTPQVNGTNIANITNDNPGLGPLQDNGGPTETLLPNIGTSPALNAGSNAAVTFANDQRGASYARVKDGVVDIGAVEVQAGATTVINNNDSGAGSLRQAVDDANLASGADSIEFGIPTGQTIALTSALNITESLTISGPTAGDADSLILDGGDNNQLVIADFATTSGETITLENITLQNGLYAGTANTYGFGGGAVFVKNANLVMNHGNVSDNATTGSRAVGGGIYVNIGNATLSQTTVSGNSTQASGGGLAVYTGNIEMTESTISGNSSGSNGGGIYSLDGTSTSIIQSTISGNFSAERGGGISSNNQTAVSQSTVVNNTAVVNGGGIFMSSFSLINLSNSILSANSAPSGNFSGNDLTASNSLFGDLATKITTDNGGNIINDIPKVGPLQDNGGPTLTHTPNVDSPAVNAGSNAAAITFSTDQRGMTFPRIVDAMVDIGAVEAPIFTYTKNHVITRAEIVKPILEAALIEPIAAGSFYGDVASNSFNANWIETFRVSGFTEDCADNPSRFCPNSVVTKEQLAKMIIKATNTPPAITYAGIFTDVPDDSFAPYIEALSTAGFTMGCATGRYCPQEAVTIEIFNNILNAAFR